MSAVLLRLGGTAVLLVTLSDIFFTVLFPASGHGPLRRPLSFLVWRAFRWLARGFHGPRRRQVLAYVGPTLVAVSIAVWPILLTVGWAMIIYPALGSGVVASGGQTPHTWMTAIYFSGFSVTTLGNGDIVPATGAYRLLAVTEAAIGFSVVSMVITYFLSIYNAIVQRKTFAASLDHRTMRTGDSSQLVAGLARQGDVTAVVDQLSTTGEFLQRLFETHQSYPVLRYFHYREVRYALPRVLLVTLDTAALITSALRGGDEQGVRDAALTLVDGAARDLLGELLDRRRAASAPVREELLRARYAQAVDRFREAGLRVREEPGAVEDYLRRRGTWEEQLRTLADVMLYDWAEIEPLQEWTRGAASRSS